LLGLKQRGLTHAPELAIADGALGFWGALDEVFPATKQQICWVHKTANVLNALPKKLHSQAKTRVHDIYRSATRDDAKANIAAFCKLYDAKYPEACATITRSDIGNALQAWDRSGEIVAAVERISASGVAMQRSKVRRRNTDDRN
jgi:transposase-like protein